MLALVSASTLVHQHMHAAKLAGCDMIAGLKAQILAKQLLLIGLLCKPLPSQQCAISPKANCNQSVAFSDYCCSLCSTAAASMLGNNVAACLL